MKIQIYYNSFFSIWKFYLKAEFFIWHKIELYLRIVLKKIICITVIKDYFKALNNL